MDLIEQSVNRFVKEQTLTNLQKVKNLGVGIKTLQNNKWQIIHVYELPFKRYIILYDDTFKIVDIGIY